jgi:hypothetical protein
MYIKLNMMKNSVLNRCFNRYAACFAIGILLVCSCGKLDYEGKEYWKQEVYIINAESTAASERLVSNTLVYTFSDTLRVINDAYELDTIMDNNPGVAYVKYKVGIGGSLPAHEDIIVKVGFDEETVNDYNTERNDSCYIPDDSLFTVNVPWDATAKAYTVVISKGSASASLIFTIPILRYKMKEYAKFAFPVKILSCEQAPLSRQYTSFMQAGLVITNVMITDWSGFPIPKLPEGRYHSQRLAANRENDANGVRRAYKYITRRDTTPEMENKYVIWGTSVWSFENQGFHKSGWMYNMLELNDQVRGTYTLAPMVAGADWPTRTFTYTAVLQKPTENNKYDPKTKTLTLYYKDVAQVGNDQIDILTYVGDDEVYGPEYTQWTWPNPVGKDPYPVQNWQQVRSKGYKWWLPIDE